MPCGEARERGLAAMCMGVMHGCKRQRRNKERRSGCSNKEKGKRDINAEGKAWNVWLCLH